MQMEYIREGMKKYLVTSWDGEECSNYEFELFMHCKVDGFLPVAVKQINEDVKLYYAMGHGVSLSSSLSHMTLSIKRVKCMVNSIRKMWETCEEYLLDPLSVVYDPKWVFVDVTSGELSFIYYPGKAGNDKEIKDFLALLLQNVDKKHEEGMLYLLKFYNQVTEEGYNVEEQEYSQVIEENKEDEQNQMQNIIPEEEPFVVKEKKNNKRKLSIRFHEVTKKLMIVVAVFDVLMLIGLCLNILTYEKMGYLFVGLAVLIAMSIIYMQIDTEETPEEMMEEYWNHNTKKTDEELPAVIDDDTTGNEEIYSGETVLLSVYEEEKTTVKELTHGNICLKPFNNERLKPVCFGHKSVVVGSMEEGCDYRLNEKGISRMHAKLMDREDGAYLIDLNSTNGTYLNGELVTPGTDYKIDEGDMISFGESEFFVAYEN